MGISGRGNVGENQEWVWEVRISSSIIVDKVYKQYEIGSARQGMMLRESLANLVTGIFRYRRATKETITAVRDVSFEVNQGEVVGLIGRNGAGKSTLLKILTKITHPTSGTVTMNGRVGSLLEVGTGFHEELTGRENVYLNGSILGMTKREVDANLVRIVEFSGIQKFFDTPIKFYSSGMRLRLGFAVAAHLETEVLLVDEVLAVGDIEFQNRCLRKMQTLQRSGRTVVFVSHNMTAVQNLCPRTLWIDQGQIRRDGNTADVLREYMAQFAEAQPAGSDLTQIEQREGTGEVRLTRIEFLDGDGEPKAVIRTGDRLTIRMHYYANQGVQDPQFGVSLCTETGALVTTMSTVEAGLRARCLPAGSGHCDLTCESFCLTAGRYVVSLWTTGPHHYNSNEHCWDVLENCAAFEVEASDFYKCGSRPGREAGLVLLPFKWDLSADRDRSRANVTSGAKMGELVGGLPTL